MKEDLFSPLALAHGPAAKNRFVLAPLTNSQSHADGRLSDDEFRWLTLRARGGFGMVITCAAHVQRQGRSFHGQLGIWSDMHLPGLERLAQALRTEGTLAIVQLDHGGSRSPRELIGVDPQAPSHDEKTGARALTIAETEALAEDFIAAALRAQQAGFDGIELHGCYILAQFLSSQANRREDRYGGSPENRARLVTDIIRGVRERCRPDFQVGLRLAPGRYGPPTGEMLAFCERLMTSGMLDWLNLHLTDLDVRPAEEEYQGKRVIDWFAGVRRGRAKLGAAGGITSGQDARWLLAQGFDFPVIGRAAVLHHDLPRKIAADREFRAIAIPVTRAYLAAEGIGDAFIERMRKYDFVAD